IDRIRLRGRTRFQTALVAAKAGFDLVRSRFESQLRILRLARALQGRTAIEAQSAIRTETRTGLGDRNLSGKAMIEIFADRFVNPIDDPGRESFTDVHMLSRYTQSHLAHLICVTPQKPV